MNNLAIYVVLGKCYFDDNDGDNGMHYRIFVMLLHDIHWKTFIFSSIWTVMQTRAGHPVAIERERQRKKTQETCGRENTNEKFLI